MRRFGALIGLSVLLTACASDGMQEKLRDATRGYNGAIRWGDMDRAAEYLPATSQQAFLRRMEQSEVQLVIVDYEVTRLDLDKEAGVAASRAQIQWHTDRRLVIETTAVDQVWQFHEGRFVLVDERRSGGTPLGLFAEVGNGGHPWLPGLEDYRKGNEIGADNKKSATKKAMRVEKRRQRKAARSNNETAAVAGR